VKHYGILGAEMACLVLPGVEALTLVPLPLNQQKKIKKTDCHSSYFLDFIRKTSIKIPCNPGHAYNDEEFGQGRATVSFTTHRFRV
jgi:hypothetical protein